MEQEAIFSRRWMCVGRAEAVEAPGHLLCATVAGEGVLLARDRGGRLGGFLNLCRHRGTRLCTEATARVGSTIRCPYHGWTYGLDGRLLAAPNLADMSELVKSEHGLHPVSVAEWAGYVWVDLDAPAPPLGDQVGPQVRDRLGSMAVLDRYGIGDLGVARTIVYDVAANWKALVENLTECYHCPTIHPELTAAVPEFSTGYGSISGGRWHGALLAEERAGFSVSGRPSWAPLPGLEQGEDRLFYGVILLPNAFLILVAYHVAVLRLDPVGPEETLVTCDWLFPREALEDPAFDPSGAVELLDSTNRQDFEACERCQLGMRSAGFRHGGVLVPSERLINDFYGYLGSALGLPPGQAWPLDPSELYRPGPPR